MPLPCVHGGYHQPGQCPEALQVLDGVIDAAVTAEYAAARRLADLLMARVASRAIEAFPGADTLHVLGEHDGDTLYLRARRITVAGNLIAGYRNNGRSSSDEWDEFVESGVDDDLDWIAGLTGDDYEGPDGHAIDLAEALNVSLDRLTDPGALDLPLDRLTDTQAVDRINLLLSSPIWVGAEGLEDIEAVVRSTGRPVVPLIPAWGEGPAHCEHPGCERLADGQLDGMYLCGPHGEDGNDAKIDLIIAAEQAAGGPESED